MGRPAKLLLVSDSKLGFVLIKNPHFGDDPESEPMAAETLAPPPSLRSDALIMAAELG